MSRLPQKRAFSYLGRSAKKFYQQVGVVFVVPLAVLPGKLSRYNLVIQQYIQWCCYAASDAFVAALHLEIWPHSNGAAL